MALRELVVEGFRGIRSARISFDQTTLLFGENDCGKSSLLEALALVLSPSGPNPPRLEPWQFHHVFGATGAEVEGPARIRLSFGETRAGSWDRPELEPLAPVLGPSRGRPRELVVEVVAQPGAAGEAVNASFEIASPGGGRPSRDDVAVLDAVRRMNPLVWLRRGVLVRPGDRAPADVRQPFGSELLADAAEVLESHGRLVAGTTAAQDVEIESGYAAAERLLAAWAPEARKRRPAARAAVAEILGRGLEAPAGRASPKARLPASLAQKLGVFLLTARIVEHLRAGTAPGVRPIIVIEEPEAGLHPTTLASVVALLQRLPAQQIVATHAGTLIAAAPVRSLRRLVRAEDGAVREWRVREGALTRDELRKVGYHLRARRGEACFARCWLLVEGETEYWLLPDLARLVGFDLLQEGVACVEFAQCGIGPLVKLADALGIEWHVLTDGDRAGDAYAQAARSLAGGRMDPSRRVTRLAERDVEHCFWRHGHARVFERLAELRSSPRVAPRRVIEKAIDRHSKPGVAFELLASVAAPGSAGAPAPLRLTIETCVALARGTAAAAGGP